MTRQATSRHRLLQAVARGLLTGVLLSAVFLAGFILRGRVPATAQEDPPDGRFPLLSEVQSLLTTNYLRDLPPARDMEYGAIRGYLSGLNDPYTFFVDPPVAQSESEALAGQYGGIGVQVKRSEHGDYVLYPFREGPAAAAGIVDGDALVAVNGVPVPNSERPDVVDRLLRGEVGEGRGVTVTVRQPDAEDTREYFIEFALVQVPSVVWRMLAEDPTLGYVQVTSFTARTPDELRTALADLKAQGAEALILDLRDNFGGLLRESVDVASEFLDGGVIFYERKRGGETETLATPGGTALDVPLVVLVNQGTASAAELVAGAIKDSGRGTLIGQRTYGKGSVQLIFRLADDSSLHITSAEWFTPAHTPLANSGLEPDIPMIPAEDGRDVELGEAVRQLQAQRATALNG